MDGRTHEGAVLGVWFLFSLQSLEAPATASPGLRGSSHLHNLKTSRGFQLMTFDSGNATCPVLAVKFKGLQPTWSL